MPTSSLQNIVPSGFTSNMLTAVGNLFQGELGVYAAVIIGVILATTVIGILINHFHNK
jgi:hypothetical protein